MTAVLAAAAVWCAVIATLVGFLAGGLIRFKRRW